MRIIQRLLLPATLVIVAAVAACSDVSAPTAVAAVDPQPTLSLQDGASYTGRFVLSPSRSTMFSDGVNTIVFPAGAVCDPATSGYGPTEWNKPCDSIRTDLTITVVATVSGGKVNLDFSPNIRFNPTRPVWLVVKNDAIKTMYQPENWAVLYNPGNGAALVDEGAIDREMITYVDRTNGVLARRVKHFTGYLVTSGTVTDCTPYVDAGCIPVGDVETQR
jgi:hypothetical protein